MSPLEPRSHAADGAAAGSPSAAEPPPSSRAGLPASSPAGLPSSSPASLPASLPPAPRERFPHSAPPPGAPLLCRDLRSKKLLLTSRPARDSSDVFDAANCCWCARTQTLLGPDRDPSHPDDCRPGRPCYRSPLPG
jgi:hypothetical protein